VLVLTCVIQEDLCEVGVGRIYVLFGSTRSFLCVHLARSCAKLSDPAAGALRGAGH
jgi:hypothetical protein